MQSPATAKRARPVEDDAVWKQVQMSDSAARTTNPIRKIVDRLVKDINHPLSFLSLSIGDPTLDGNLLPPRGHEAIFSSVLEAHKTNGYLASHGAEEARSAVAQFYQRKFTKGNATFAASDVVLASGASHALELVMTTLCNPGDAILLPKPGFSLYNTIAENRGYKQVFYPCLAHKDWEIDLDALEQLAVVNKGTIKAFLITNPSNPCGSNFTEQHVRDLIAFADRHKLPVIADEIYAGMVFDPVGHPFVSVAAVNTTVPCYIVGGIAKSMVAPGWRLGWVIRNDPGNVGGAILQGIVQQSQTILGPCSLVQGALPQLLATPDQYFDDIAQTLRQHAEVCYAAFEECGLHPTKPGAAMYMLVGVPTTLYADDVEFCVDLLREQNVSLLPGSIFGAPNFVRIVFTKPIDQLREAVRRIGEFCKSKQQVKIMSA